MFQCKKKNSCMHCIIAEKTIALVINTWKCQGERMSRRGHIRKTEHISVRYCPPFMSVGIFLNLDNAPKETCEKKPSKCPEKLIVNFAFFRMTPCLSFIQYTHLYSVLHMSQINVRWTSLRTGDVALCPDNLRPIKQTSTADMDCLLLSLFKITWLQPRVTHPA